MGVIAYDTSRSTLKKLDCKEIGLLKETGLPKETGL